MKHEQFSDKLNSLNRKLTSAIDFSIVFINSQLHRRIFWWIIRTPCRWHIISYQILCTYFFIGNSLLKCSLPTTSIVHFIWYPPHAATAAAIMWGKIINFSVCSFWKTIFSSSRDFFFFYEIFFHLLHVATDCMSNFIPSH